ncbi:MAG: hypothetical protein KDF59_14245 [Nitrosomonas sp.]|nr:hypothetical protein [Nitrosomonas sp.]
MYTSFIRACFLLFIFLLPISAQSAGLGKLTVNSALGQPFSAEIDLVTVNAQELSTLKVSIASYEAYVQAGIQYEPFFSTFNLSIEPRVGGEPYIKISSPQAVNEPFLNLLVELNWASGRLLREYTVLLDPADIQRPEPIAPVVPSVPAEPAAAFSADDTVIEESEPLAAHPVEPEPAAQPEQSVQQPAAIPATRLTENRPNTYGPVLQGDTLSSIAMQVKPGNVNVNQMLVALFRANREAFIANNMNLLRTGVVLDIPEVEDLNTITQQEADAEVKLQVSDWQKYRQNLALTVQQGQEPEALRQVDTGQIATTVDDVAITPHDSPEEVLRLSSGELISGTAEAQANQHAVERLRMMEEDAIARNLALEEANERIAMLEKNIENLQQLLALQSPEMAKAQADAEALIETPALDLQVPEPQSDLESIEILPTETDAILESEYDLFSDLDEMGFELDESFSEPADESVAPELPAAPLEQLPPPVTTPVPQPEPVETSFMDILLEMVMDNLMIIGGLLIILPLILLAVKLRKKRKEREAEAEAEEEARHEENAAALRSKAAAVVAAAHSVDSQAEDSSDDDHNVFDDEPEPHQDETKMHLESEQSDFTESADDSLTEDKDRSFDLDFSQEVDQFMEDSSSQASEDDSSLTDDQSSESELTEIAESADENLLDFPENEPSQSDDTDFSLDDVKTDTVEALEIDLTEDTEKSDSASIETAQEADLENSLDFSVDPSTIDLSDENALEESSATDDEINVPDLDDNMNTLEFDASSGADDSDNTENTSEKAADIDFSDINLDLENSSDEQPIDQTEVDLSHAESSDNGTQNEQWHEVETKIDLAKAYLDMEDKEGAKEMLEEVLQDGDEQQKEAAKKLLEGI